MKVLFLITGLRMGGAENQLFLLVKQLKIMGLKLMVVSMEQIDIIGERMLNDDIEVRYLNMSKSIASVVNGKRKINQIISDFGPDVIHSHMIHANIFSRFIKRDKRNVKLINTAHNIREGGPLMMSLYKLTKERVDFCTNVSEEAFTEYVKKGFFKKEKSDYIPNAIDIQRFKTNNDGDDLRNKLNITTYGHIFLAAGRLHPQKNYKLLLAAFKKVLKIHSNSCLLIAGEGSQKEELQLLCKNLDIVANVKFLGMRDDLPELMRISNTFVLTSDYEGFGLVVGEAMAAMTPVIATNSGGVKEVMGGFGALIAPGDGDGLMKTMVNAIMMKPDYEDILAAQKHIENSYSISNIASRWVDKYEKLLNEI